MINHINSMNGRLFAFALLLLISISLAESNAKVDIGTDLVFSKSACIDFFKVGWDNWRVLTVVGLLISIAFVSLYYMGGVLISDSGTVAKAKDDLFQIFATAVLVILIFAIVQIMCDETIADALLFNDRNLFEAAGNYLFQVVNWTKYDTLKAGTIFSMMTIIESTISSAKTPVPTGIGESFSLFYDQAVTFFFFPFLAYISALLQIQILYFVQPLALSVMIPIGIILRSISPFRSFGGALLGTGIALLVFFPLLIALNALFLQDYVKVDTTDLACKSNSECLSKVCITPIVAGSTVLSSTSAPSSCLAKRGPGIICGEDKNFSGDWQCLSGRCEDGKCANPILLNESGKGCTTDGNCRNGLWCDSGVCKEHKPLWFGTGSKTQSECARSEQCGLPGVAYCSFTDKVCVSAKVVGGSCKTDKECMSLRCKVPENVCIAAKVTESQLQYEVQKSDDVSTLAGAIDIRSSFTDLTSIFVLSLTAGLFMPLINFMLLSRAIRDLSAFLGNEVDLAKIYQIL